MAGVERKLLSTESSDERCDIRIWSAECGHSDYTSSRSKYLCDSCGIILNLNHEMHHEIYPHVVGDADFLY
jgi:hypothetical protein